ncbi:MAG: amidase [Thiolinea sp.]
MSQSMPDTTFTGPEICKLPAREVVALLKKGEVSPKELLDASFSRIEQVEPVVNATVTRCPERAYAALDKLGAQAADNDQYAGWLAGLPIAIKDLTTVSGVKTTFGSWGMRDFVPETSGPLVERLEDRGGVVVGKTNTPEFGAGGNTFNQVFGYTRNPWDTRKNAGGSSGGAAVSLATGEVWLSQGSDLAGSLRTPAAYCGVCGFRPTPGRAGGGPDPAAFLMEGISGPMARDVEDTALFLDAMAGFDPREPITIEEPRTSFQDALKQERKNIRIAFSPDQNGFAPVEANIRQIMAQAMASLETSGITVDESCPELPDLYETYISLRGMHFGAVNSFIPEPVQKHFKETLRKNIATGVQQTAEDIYRAVRSRTDLYQRMRVFLQDFDVLALPVVGLEPGLVEDEYPLMVDGVPTHDYVDWLKFSYLATTTALPSLALPVGFTDSGMPVGMQLIGPPRGEAVVLQVGLAVEQALNLGIGVVDPVVR